MKASASSLVTSVPLSSLRLLLSTHASAVTLFPQFPARALFHHTRCRPDPGSARYCGPSHHSACPSKLPAFPPRALLLDDFLCCSSSSSSSCFCAPPGLTQLSIRTTTGTKRGIPFFPKPRAGFINEGMSDVISCSTLLPFALKVLLPRTGRPEDLLPVGLQSVARGTLLHLVFKFGQNGEQLYQSLVWVRAI